MLHVEFSSEWTSTKLGKFLIPSESLSLSILLSTELELLVIPKLFITHWTEP